MLQQLENAGGGDEKWRGDWYPGAMIADRHFRDYAREMLEDCGDIPRDLPSYIEIDWEATARNIRLDYTPIEVEHPKMSRKLTFWVR